MLLNLIAQDLAAGAGLALLDPHGDLAELVLAPGPEDTAATISFTSIRPTPNGRSASIPSPACPSRSSRSSPTAWSPPFVTSGRTAGGHGSITSCPTPCAALLDVPGGTLLMLPRLLTDEAFRVHVVEHHVTDPVVRAFWTNEYARYGEGFRTEAISPIQNKIGKVLMEPRLRNMLAQPKSTITPRTLMDRGAIVVCNLSKGGLGESTSHLLGALLVTAFAQAALSRADSAEAERRVFHLYADEFQSFATESFALILSEARKYALTLTMAHQYLDQLPDRSAGRGVRQCRLDRRAAHRRLRTHR